MDSGLSYELLGVAFGMIVGMSLGLTGGGGSIFAVPLLTYGLGVPVGAALGLSLASVGATAGFGAALRLRAREIELQAGVIFSVVGMVVAPIGAVIGHRIAPAILLSAFAVMMGYVGMRMWRGRTDAPVRPGPCVTQGHGKLTASCYAMLSIAGAASGLLSGLFGVGGGFVIVPSLLYAGIKIHRAVATSLMVIFLISVSGVVANIVQGQQFPVRVTALFLEAASLECSSAAPFARGCPARRYKRHSLSRCGSSPFSCWQKTSRPSCLIEKSSRSRQ